MSMLRLPGPAPGVWHGEFPDAWRPVFTTTAWADLAAQVMAMDGPGATQDIPAGGGWSAARPPGRAGGGGGGGGDRKSVV